MHGVTSNPDLWFSHCTNTNTVYVNQKKGNLSKILKAPKPTCSFSMSNCKMIYFFRSNTQSSGCNSVKQFYILPLGLFFPSVLSFNIFSNALICPWNRRLETLHALNISTLKKAFSTSWDFMCHLSGTRACKTLTEMAPCRPPKPPPEKSPRSKISLQVIPQPPETKRRVRPYKQYLGDLCKYLLPFQLIQTSGACIWISGISSSCIPNRS